MSELAASYLKSAKEGLVDQFYSPYQPVTGLSFAGRYLEYGLIKELSEEGLKLDQLLKISGVKAAGLSKEFLEKKSKR